MLRYIHAESLYSLGINQPHNYEQLVDYIDSICAFPSVLTNAEVSLYIKQIPDNYCTDPFILMTHSRIVDIDLLVKKMHRSALITLFEQIEAEIDSSYVTTDTLIAIAKELGDSLPEYGKRCVFLAPLLNRKLLECDIRTFTPWPVYIYEHLLQDHIYESSSLLTLIRYLPGVFDNYTLPASIYEKLVMYLEQQPHILNIDTRIWIHRADAIGIIDNLVFECMRNNVYKILEPPFGYLLELMSREHISYYLLLYGMCRVSITELMADNDFRLYFNAWSNSEISECELYSKLVRECLAINPYFIVS